MKRRALFVGVNDYIDTAFKKLRYSLSDAVGLSGAFAARGFDVEVLSNPKADAVLAAVERKASGLGPGDVFLFFFAGHGFTAPDGSHLLICANDRLAYLRHNRAGIPVDLLEDITNGRGCNRAFLLDACRTDVFAGVENRGAETRDLALVTLPDAKVHAGTCCVLRSCDRFCPAMEFDDLGHGVFTRAVMDVLGDDSFCATPFGEKFVAGIRLRMHVILSAHGVAGGQNPCFQTNGEAFFLFDGVAPKPSAPQPPPQHPQPAAPVLVTCPVCLGNVQPVGTHNCVTCGKKYVCADCWDKEYKRCTECAGKMREADNLLAEGKRCKERKDYQEAAECFRKAADLENIEAYHHYGDMLLYGLGVKKDVGAALEFYRKCDDSDAWIQYDIGMCHLHFAKEESSKEEGAEAVAWLQKSAERGVPWACVNLGDCYRDGIGLPRQDFAKAAKCYRRALEDKGHKLFGDHGAAQWAEFCMGWLCRNGQGVEKDLGAALQWFRKAAARKGDATDPASIAAAEVLPDVLVERYGAKLGQYWQDFRIIHGVQILDADGRLVPLAGLVASNKGIFVGVSIESLPSSIRSSLPSDNPAWPFARSVSDDCGIPLKCLLATLVVPDAFPVPNAEFPSWADRESDWVDAMLRSKSKAQEPPDWLGKRQDIIRNLEKLPMSSEGAEKNALIHFEAAVPEWEDGAALLEKVGKPSPKLIQLARRAAEELEQAGKHSIADNVRKWLDKKGAEKSRPAALPKTSDVKKLTLPGGAEMEMIYCSPGEFLMGSPENEEGRNDNETHHRVRLTKGFWLGKYPVTQRQWQSVMGNNPSDFRDDDLPVENVSWDDCKDFIDKVKSSAKQQLGGEARFPTEAEWEYACRAGTTAAYFWGNALNGDKANCDGNYPCGTKTKGPYLEKTTPVGRYGANAWGFADMHGNVREWCADWFGNYSGDAVDPTGPSSGGNRVLRGGSWISGAWDCRSASRRLDIPGIRDSGYGFRLSCSVGPRG